MYGNIDYNEKYLTASNSYGILFIIDINQNKIISKFIANEPFGIICLKKFIHPKYGESILTRGKNYRIILWTTK